MVCLIPFQGDSSMVVNTGSSRNRQIELSLKLRAAQQQYRVHLQDMFDMQQPVPKQADIKLAKLRVEVLRLEKLAYPDM